MANYGTNDKNCSVNSRKFQLLIKHLADHAKIGIHPSYASNKSFDISDKTKIRLIEHLTKISGEKGLLKGQYLDLSQKNKSIIHRIEINKLKTGKLMSYCCSAVGIASKKNKITVNRLSKVGLYIGEIFQINDDIEDYPRMRKEDKSALLAYKMKLYKKTIYELKILRVKSRKIYLLIDFLMDLKV